MSKNKHTANKHKPMTQHQLEQWQQNLERDTKYLHWILFGGIMGGFAMVSALGIWVYLAYTM